MLVVFGIVGLTLVGTVSGVGAFLGNRLAQNASATNSQPLQLQAGTAARGKSLSMATGLIDENVEGLFVLDHVSGDIQCWLLSPRTGAVGGIYKANVVKDLGVEKAGDADYAMATGNFNFIGNNAGNVGPGNSICYVADTKSGKVVGYGIIYDKQAIRRGNVTGGELKVVCKGAIRGEQLTRDQ